MLHCKFVIYSLQHTETWCITRLSTTNHRWVINAQTGPGFFGPPCNHCLSFGQLFCILWSKSPDTIICVPVALLSPHKEVLWQNLSVWLWALQLN